MSESEIKNKINILENKKLRHRLWLSSNVIKEPHEEVKQVCY